MSSSEKSLNQWSRRDRWIHWGYGLAVAAFLIVFFIHIHPVTVFDTDDWIYMYQIREAVPIWGYWNPGRVFPEVLMPFCGAVAGYLVAWVTGDYFNAVTLVMGTVVALFVVFYLLCFDRLLERKWKLAMPETVMLSLLFLLCHFWAMRTIQNNNPYLFRSINATGYFYYTVPVLLNGGLVMLLESGMAESLWEKRGYLRKGLFLLAVYFGIFSNLYGSQVISIYAGVRWLGMTWRYLRRKLEKQRFLQECVLNLGIVMVWLISMVFELSGDRASGVSDGYDHGLLEAVRTFRHLPEQLNRNFLLMTVVIVVLFELMLWKNRSISKEERKDLLSQLLGTATCSVLTAVYIILLCSVITASYAKREDVLLPLAFYGFLLLFRLFASLMQMSPRLLMVMPLLLVLIYCDTNTSGSTFMQSNIPNLPTSTCQEVNRVILRQVQEAVEENQSSVEIHLPKWDTEDNWPHALDPNRYVLPLYKNGVISRLIKASVVADESFEETYGLLLER